MTAMKGWRGPRTLLVLAVLLAGTCAWAWTRSAGDVPARSAVGTSPTPTAVLRVDTSRLGDDFEPGAVGLSIETSELTTGRLSAAHCEARRTGSKVVACGRGLKFDRRLPNWYSARTIIVKPKYRTGALAGVYE